MKAAFIILAAIALFALITSFRSPVDAEKYFLNITYPTKGWFQACMGPNGRDLLEPGNPGYAGNMVGYYELKPDDLASGKTIVLSFRMAGGAISNYTWYVQFKLIKAQSLEDAKSGQGDDITPHVAIDCHGNNNVTFFLSNSLSSQKLLEMNAKSWNQWSLNNKQCVTVPK